jgi:hypothetical protein
LDAG